MKKIYLVPSMEVTAFCSGIVLVGASTLNPEEDNPSVKPSEEEWDDEFGSRGHRRDAWDDPEDEE